MHGPIPWKEALRIALEVCEGLRLIHQQGIIHRDLKSANIMLCERGGTVLAVLMDFGLALDASLKISAPEGTTETEMPAGTLPGTIAGTPAYMAPEQFEGEPVSPATDIYALGVVLYEIVTGLRPYAASTPVGAAIRRAKRPAPVSSIQQKVPRQWDRVIEHCLQYEPTQRFQSADQVATALRASPANLDNLRRDRPWIIWLTGAAILAAITWAMFVWLQSRQYYRPNDEARHWYDAGVTALREGSYLRATHAFGKATQQDSQFLMAHARLAEAWSNLDFDGTAQREMLIATAGERHIPPLDRMYLDAIRATLTHNFGRALDLYKQILGDLPNSEKSAGNLDVGMAHERLGEMQSALQSYALAATLDRDNPGSVMHTAILNTRLHNIPEAERAFAQAEALFRTEVNPEGLAELDYQRGYLANEQEATDEANAYLKRALAEAQQLPNLQLQIRALTQLSSVAYNSDHDGEAVDLAEQAIRLARDNQLNTWAADGLTRLASAQLDQGHYPQADDALGEAFQILNEGEQSRVDAFANVTLASLRNQQHRVDEVLKPAQLALNYYKANGYYEEAATASLLITRTQRNKGQLKEALQSGTDLLALAARSGKQRRLMQAEELEGTIFLAMESYPDALVHFRNASSLAPAGNLKSYQALHCADVLWRIGRYTESDKELESVPSSNTFAAEIRAAALLSQQRYAQAQTVAEKMIAQAPDMAADRKQELERDLAVSNAYRGKTKLALAHLESMLAARGSGDPAEDAELELVAAKVYLAAGDAQEARDAAMKAESYFASQDLLDSAFRSALLGATASKALGDALGYRTFSNKAIDNFSNLQQTWDARIIETYISRPDIQPMVRELNHPSK